LIGESATNPYKQYKCEKGEFDQIYENQTFGKLEFKVVVKKPEDKVSTRGCS
jgi:hypothetical protein